MASLPDLIISSFKGGMDDTLVPSALPDDQCVSAVNVEFFASMLGERRNGCGPLDLTSAGLGTETVIVHISQWYPTNIVTTPAFFAVSATAGVSSKIAYRNTSNVWAPIVPTDALNTTVPDIYNITSQSLNGKLFVACRTAVDRLHVSDGTNLRRTCLAAPAAAPTAADDAGAGTFSGVRYYRVRYLLKSGSTIVTRSEPSAVLTFTPVGTKAGVTVTKPASITEGETHWELEASEDNVLFYLLATTVVGTTTFDDTTVYTTGYSAGTLSDAIGSYLLQPSAKFLAVDGDRLIGASHYTDLSKGSQVWWTPPFNDPGVGNDERLPIVTTGGANINTSTHLDNYDGGPITGIAASTFGTWYAFKYSSLYQFNRTGDSTRAYDVITLSRTIGAIPNSIVRAVDENGSTCIYFLDPVSGPYRIGPQGLQQISGLRSTWARVNLGAANVVANGCYYPYKEQVHWNVAVDGGDSPTLGLVLQVTELSPVDALNRDIGRGWSLKTGRITNAFCMATLTELVSINGITSLSSRPFVGLTTPDYIQRCDTLSTDAGVAYVATITSKPYLVAGLLNRWGAMAASLLVTANATAPGPKVRFIRDMGLENSVTVTSNLVPIGNETLVINDFDSLRMSGARMIQIQFSDV